MDIIEHPTHLALGALTYYIEPRLAVLYLVYQWRKASLETPPQQCKGWKEGIEYGIGYFGVFYLYRWYFGA